MSTAIKQQREEAQRKEQEQLTVVSWLSKHNIFNPYLIPTPELQKEFDTLFEDVTLLWPQPGGQEQFQSCAADVCIYGGEAGAGKSWNLLFDHIKWINNPLYIGIVVRKTYSQIFDAGSLWDEAVKIFGLFGGKPVRSPKPMFEFPSGAKIYFKHSQHAQDVVKNWQGPQAAVISMDEITQFTRREFLYAIGRLRSMSGIQPYMRLTCNPDPFSWVKDLIAWWIDEDGFIIPERSGIIRYFAVVDSKFIIKDTREEIIAMFEGTEASKYLKTLSFTFVRGYLEENQKLLEIDPDYKAKLEMLEETDKQSMSRGNWSEVDDDNSLFQKSNIDKNRIEFDDFNINNMARIAVGVDPAGGAKDENDETGIICAGVDDDGDGYIWEDHSGHYKPHEWSEKVCSTFEINSGDIVVAERNYGGDMVESTIGIADPNINVKMVTSSRGKYLRAEPIAALYKRNQVHHVGHNLEELEKEMYKFRQKQDKSPNRLDAAVFALTELMLGHNYTPRARSLLREELKSDNTQNEESNSKSQDKDYNSNEETEMPVEKVWRY